MRTYLWSLWPRMQGCHITITNQTELMILHSSWRALIQWWHLYAIMILPMQRKTHRFTKRLSQRCLITLRRNTMFSRMAGYQAFRTRIKATAIFLLGEKQTVSNGIKQDGSMAWMQHRPQMRIRPLFADTGILRMAIANTNTRGPSLEKMRTSLPIMVPELLP